MIENQNELIPRALIARMIEQRETGLYRAVIESVDRELLTEDMGRMRGNQSTASEFLDLSRMALRSELRSLGLLR